MSIIFSPQIVLESMLRVSFSKTQKKLFQQVTGVSERRVRDWFSKGKMGKISEFRNLMKRLSQNDSCLWCPATPEEFVRMFKNPTWGEFASIWLMDAENAYLETMKFILITQHQNRNSGPPTEDFHRLDSCLPAEIVRRLHTDLTQRGLKQAQRNDIIEVLALIYFLASLEAEYCESISRDSLFLEKILPRYRDCDKGEVWTPVEIFFQHLEESLIENDLFQNREILIKQLEMWTDSEPESVLRGLARYQSEAIIPSWATYNNWAEMFALRSVKLASKTKREIFSKEETDKQAQFKIEHLQTLFGGACLLDQAFRLSYKALFRAKRDPVAFFRTEYLAAAKRVKKTRCEAAPR